MTVPEKGHGVMSSILMTTRRRYSRTAIARRRQTSFIASVPPPLSRPIARLSALLFLGVVALTRGVGSLAAAVPIPNEYTLREWHETDGLPSDELTAVQQDAQGFLWIASGSALVRFDGAVFEPSEIPPGGIPRGLARIRDTTDGKSDELAIPGTLSTTHATGYFILHEDHFRFEPESELNAHPVQTIFAGHDGSLWFGCEDGTVLRQRASEKQLFESPANLVSKKAPAFATDKEGQLWILRGNRLERLQGEQFVEVVLARPEPELRIASSATGGIWLFTRAALWRWSGKASEEVRKLPDRQGAHFIQTALEDSHGYLWVGTRSQGLFRIIGRDILHVPTSSEYVVALCEDSEGNLWVACNGGGLSRLRPRAHRLLDRSSGLKDNFSYTVAEDAMGAVWLANRDGGMVRIANGVIDPVSTRTGWREFSAMSVYPSPDGHIWMTSGIGEFRTDATNPETATRIPALSALRNIRSTFVARNGDYWLAVDPDRVVRWRANQLTTFGPPEGFDGHEVRAFAEDSAGRIWLGAADGRLFRSNGDRFEKVSFPNSDTCGSLQVIRFESDGTILLGTTRRGVVIFPAGDLSRPRMLDSSHGLPGNNITQILQDDFDRTWFASRTGVFWIHSSYLRDFASGRTEDVHAVLLGRDDDLPDLTCLGLFQPAAWKAHDGTLWFATRRGMLHADPALVTPSTEAPPPVAVTAVVCDGHARSFDTAVKFPSVVRKIQLRLSALNLSAAQSVQVRYRLDNFDPDWLILDHTRTITYPRLPPGRYTLSTMGSNGNGSWSSQPALLTMVVTPPWWQALWFRVAVVLGSIALVGAVVRHWSHRRLRLRLERSESAHSIERERTRIARNIHDDLGASLTRISLLTQSARQDDSAHSTTLDKIHDVTRSITRSMDEIVWAVNPEQDNPESLVYYVGNFAQALLGAAGIRCRLESPDALPSTPLNSNVRYHLFLGCKEALNNIVKHAHATEVTIRISIGHDALKITIADNGRGFDPQQPPAVHPLRPHAGNGLRNLEKRLAEIRGTCTIGPGPGGGTIVTLVAPWPIAARE